MKVTSDQSISIFRAKSAGPEPPYPHIKPSGTRTQNAQNSKKQKNCSSSFKGVYWQKRSKKWHAGITYNGKPNHLGYFDSEIEAAKVYDREAKEFFGEFAKTNF